MQSFASGICEIQPHSNIIGVRRGRAKVLISNPHSQKFFAAHFHVVNDAQSQHAAPIPALLAHAVLCDPTEAMVK